MKECSSCHKVKSLSDFYSHPGMANGYLNKCKTCTCRDVNANYATKKKDPIWFAKERERKRQCQQKRRDAGLVPPVPSSAIKKWARKNPHKIKAYNKINRGPGKLSKGSECEECGLKTTRLHKHHDDYDKPFDVRRVCPKCHGKKHRKKV